MAKKSTKSDKFAALEAAQSETVFNMELDKLRKDPEITNLELREYLRARVHGEAVPVNVVTVIEEEVPSEEEAQEFMEGIFNESLTEE